MRLSPKRANGCVAAVSLRPEGCRSALPRPAEELGGQPNDERFCLGFDGPAALLQLRRVAERKEDDFFQRRGLADARDFLRQFQRLSAAPHQACTGFGKNNASRFTPGKCVFQRMLCLG